MTDPKLKKEPYYGICGYCGARAGDEYEDCGCICEECSEYHKDCKCTNGEETIANKIDFNPIKQINIIRDEINNALLYLEEFHRDIAYEEFNYKFVYSREALDLLQKWFLRNPCGK